MPSKPDPTVGYGHDLNEHPDLLASFVKKTELPLVA